MEEVYEILYKKKEELSKTIPDEKGKIESNAYDNRAIDAYSVGMESMLESERIKGEIANWEHDLWEF